MKSLLAIGMMSGTSLDGIDAVLVRIDGDNHYEIVASETGSYTEEERKLLFDICSVDNSNVAQICMMNSHIGEKFARVVNRLLDKSGYTASDISFISSHGQTIHHLPKQGENEWERPSTLQIGDLSVLSERTNIGVIGDFRTADMAAGGQGAPLTSFVDYVLFVDNKKSRAIQNIGGIGNVTYIPANNGEKYIHAFDTGPGNMMIDELVLRMTNHKQTYDKDGKIASKGMIHQPLLDDLMSESYLQVAPPKTTGRELFGRRYIDNILDKYYLVNWEDLICTVTEFTCQSIVFHYKTYLGQIDEVIIGGGGAYNQFMVNRLRKLLPESTVHVHENFGISSDFKEALAFAILGYYALKGEYNMIPTATGAKHPVILGKMTATQPESMNRMISVRNF